MKTTRRSLSACAVALALVLFSCYKEGQQSNPPENSSESQTHADDQSRISNDFDDVAFDASIAVEGTPTFSGRFANTTGLCGVEAAFDTASGNRTITLAYNGPNCQGTTFRTGTVVLSMARDAKWKTPGATMTVTFQNLQVKRIRDNKTITLNGTQTVTNVDGGLVWQLAPSQTITHTVTSSNMSITFDDGSQRTWNVARKKEFTLENGQLVVAVTGIGTTGSVTNAAEWGANRFGRTFVTSITQPLVVRQDCLFRLTAGQVKHEGFATSTVTFGLNSAGQPTSCPASGSYFFKLVWAGPNGASATAVLPY